MKQFKIIQNSLEYKRMTHIHEIQRRVNYKYAQLYSPPPKFSRDYIVFTNFWWQYYDALLHEEFPKYNNYLYYKNFYQKYPKFVDKLKIINTY